jgi:hypothetical protein
VDERVNRAKKLRDATHVSNYTRAELLARFAAAGLGVRAEGDVREAARRRRLAVGDRLRRGVRRRDQAPDRARRGAGRGRLDRREVGGAGGEDD